MKQIVLGFFFLLTATTTFSQLLATVEMKEQVEGICNPNAIYVLFPMFGDQVEAKCEVSKEEIARRINSEIPLLNNNPKFKGKGSISVYVNCEGEMVFCSIEKKKKTQEVYEQIENVFITLGEWVAGTLNGDKVDSSRLFGFTIKKGTFAFTY